MSLWWTDTNAGVKLVKMMNDPHEGRAGKNEWDQCRDFPLAIVGVTPPEVPNYVSGMGFVWIQITASCSHLG